VRTQALDKGNLTWPRVATRAQLQIGLDAWRALANPDPRALAAIMRSGTPALPLLGGALHRHLRELPSCINGLSLTQERVLTLLSERPHSLFRMFGRLVYSMDPLPGQGDSQMRDRVLCMEDAGDRVFTREPGLDPDGNSRPPWTDVLTITELGRAVLCGAADFQALGPPPRWVGGVEIAVGNPDWRWNDSLRDAVRR
jgi:hypothetical protein